MCCTNWQHIYIQQYPEHSHASDWWCIVSLYFGTAGCEMLTDNHNHLLQQILAQCFYHCTLQSLATYLCIQSVIKVCRLLNEQHAINKVYTCGQISMTWEVPGSSTVPWITLDLQWSDTNSETSAFNPVRQAVVSISSVQLLTEAGAFVVCIQTWKSANDIQHLYDIWKWNYDTCRNHGNNSNDM